MTDKARDTNGCGDGFLSHPLFRLLAINLASGIAVALLLLTGILLLNPHRIRDLLLADENGVLVLLLIGCGFIVTFGSVAMGSAIMALGRSDRPRSGKRKRGIAIDERTGSMALAPRHTGNRRAR